MSRETFDALLTSTPQNKVAARVLGRGEHFEISRPLAKGRRHWTSPPPMKPFVRNGATAQMTDLTGKQFGRFTVLGLLAHKHSEGAQWVVRCACGDYECRPTRSIRKQIERPVGDDDGGNCDRCHNCAELVRIKWRYKTYGARPVTDFFEPTKTQKAEQS